MKGQTASEVCHLCLLESGLQGITGTLGVVVGLQPFLDDPHPGEGRLHTLRELLLLLLRHDQSWAGKEENSSQTLHQQVLNVKGQLLCR